MNNLQPNKLWIYAGITGTDVLCTQNTRKPVQSTVWKLFKENPGSGKVFCVVVLDQKTFLVPIPAPFHHGSSESSISSVGFLSRPEGKCACHRSLWKWKWFYKVNIHFYHISCLIRLFIMSSLLSSDVLMSRHLSTAQVTRAFAWCLGLCVME